MLDAGLWDENSSVGSSARKEKEAAETLGGGKLRHEGVAKKKSWVRPEQPSEVCGIDAGPCGGTSIEVRAYGFLFAQGNEVGPCLWVEPEAWVRTSSLPCPGKVPARPIGMLRSPEREV